MSAISIPDYGPVTYGVVYGLTESVRRAKLPMAVDPDSLTDVVTEVINKLAASRIGTGHDQWLTGVVVQFDLTVTVKMWTEFQRYHFADFISSQSTMHRIARFDLDNSYIKYVDPEIIRRVKQLVARYNETHDPEDYLRLLYSNPCGMKLTAGITTNYRQLKTMYAQRRDHRLPEWREFCEWMELLPGSAWITGSAE